MLDSVACRALRQSTPAAASYSSNTTSRSVHTSTGAFTTIDWMQLASQKSSTSSTQSDSESA